jgi:hypothetical protein
MRRFFLEHGVYSYVFVENQMIFALGFENHELGRSRRPTMRTKITVDSTSKQRSIPPANPTYPSYKNYTKMTETSGQLPFAVVSPAAPITAQRQPATSLPSELVNPALARANEAADAEHPHGSMERKPPR